MSLLKSVRAVVSCSLTQKLLAGVLASLFVAGSALAQTHGPTPLAGPAVTGGTLKGQAAPVTTAITYKQKTSYDFDDDQVEGAVVQPDMDVVTGRSKSHHDSLVRARTTFQPEMLKSVESL